MLTLILCIFAFVLFVLAAWPAPSRPNLGWAGMACLTAAYILANHPLQLETVSNFSKLSPTDLQAYLQAELCHVESKTLLSHDDPHIVNIREAIDALTKLALLAKFNTHGNYREMVEQGGLRGGKS